MGRPALTTKQFITRARKAHGDKYDYSKVKYKRSKIPVSIICSIHGKFDQTPHGHLKGHNCPKCGCENMASKKRKTVEQFICESQEVHGKCYSYTKVVYEHTTKPVVIVCPIHGDFKKRPNLHLIGFGCPKCTKPGRPRKSIKQFIKEATKIHGPIYDYNKLKEIYNHAMVTIGCSIHGEFIQRADAHLQGASCPQCRSSKGEREVARVLNDLRIAYTQQWKAKSCIINKLSGRFDFKLIGRKILIEFDGQHHFEPCSFGSKLDPDKYFKKVKVSDRKKNSWAKKNDYCLLRIAYTDFHNIEEIVTREARIRRWI